MNVAVICVCVTSIFTTAVATGSEIATLCPHKCTCHEGDQSTSLTVDCARRPDIDAGQLTEQLDLLLSSNLTYGRLTSLSIVNGTLMHVPRSVCRLTTLTQLHLDYNQLTRLPDNCFTNLTALAQLTAIQNSISELQDGLFDGLQNLEILRLNRNNISSIGLSVFNSSAMLNSLQFVNLRFNKLTALEPWPYFVGINGKPEQRASINLDSNFIRHFTNHMHLKLECGMKKPSMDIDLSHNRFKHMSDILHAWNLSTTTMLCLFPFVNDRTNSVFRADGNHVDCDCVDFDIYKMARVIPKVKALDGVYCGKPNSLYRTRVTSVPLDQLVCELKERCPPGCRCVHRPANATLHVYCSNSNLTALPLELPALPKSYTKYKLDLSNNKRFHRLEPRDYFVNTSILDVSNCKIEAVDNWKNLFMVKHVYLHGNRLASIPRSVTTLNVSTKKLSLYNNPWRCNCNDKWFPKWLNESIELLLNPSRIRCSSPQRLYSRNLLLAAGEFCIHPETNAPTVGVATFFGVVSLAVALVALLSVGVIVYRLRVRLYTRWKFHPFDRDECLGEDMHYDVFLSCCSSDNLPYGNRIREQLEERGYLVCYPPRDFLAGDTIYDNIYNAVVRSKRTVCFLTTNFIRSSYCMQEFDVALHHNIMVKRKKRLIVLMALDSPNDLYANDASATASLRQYLHQYTYIDYTADDWLDKLLYALPLGGLLQQDNNRNSDHLLGNIQPTDVDVDDDVPMIN